MKHKTSELTGALLDAAVSKAEGFPFKVTEAQTMGKTLVMALGPDGNAWYPSSHWAHGGPLKERERIGTSFEEVTGLWHAEREHPARADGVQRTFASSPRGELEAAMRCLVASKLGEEVEL